jgi:hypothetical protein
MDRIEDLRAFVAVVERGSPIGAARRLGRSLQSVSRSLAALERDIGDDRPPPRLAGFSFVVLTPPLPRSTRRKRRHPIAAPNRPGCCASRVRLHSRRFKLSR